MTNYKDEIEEIIPKIEELMSHDTFVSRAFHEPFVVELIDMFENLTFSVREDEFYCFYILKELEYVYRTTRETISQPRVFKDLSTFHEDFEKVHNMVWKEYGDVLAEEATKDFEEFLREYFTTLNPSFIGKTAKQIQKTIFRSLNEEESIMAEPIVMFFYYKEKNNERVLLSTTEPLPEKGLQRVFLRL